MKRIISIFVLLHCSFSVAMQMNQFNLYIPLVTNNTNKPYTLKIGQNTFLIPPNKQRRFLRFPITIKKITGIEHQSPIELYTDSDSTKTQITIPFGCQKAKHFVAANLLRKNSEITSTRRSSKWFYEKIDLYITLAGNDLQDSTLQLKKRKK